MGIPMFDPYHKWLGIPPKYVSILAAADLRQLRVGQASAIPVAA